MNWDPHRTLQTALWITGGQWAGKSTVCGILAERHGLVHYNYDFHTTRGHEDRRIAAQLRRGEPVTEFDAEAHFVRATPAESAAMALATFPERFEWALDDIRALTTPHPVIADGWGLRPELILKVTDDPGRILVMLPSEEFRLAQQSRMERARMAPDRVSDPARAEHNRRERDRLIAADAVATAHRHGVRVLEVDGTHDAEHTADLVAAHFRLAGT